MNDVINKQDCLEFIANSVFESYNGKTIYCLVPSCFSLDADEANKREQINHYKVSDFLYDNHKFTHYKVFWKNISKMEVTIIFYRGDALGACGDIKECESHTLRITRFHRFLRKMKHKFFNK